MLGVYMSVTGSYAGRLYERHMLGVYMSVMGLYAGPGYDVG
jgi:hypothetical protein